MSATLVLLWSTCRRDRISMHQCRRQTAVCHCRSYMRCTRTPLTVRTTAVIRLAYCYTWYVRKRKLRCEHAEYEEIDNDILVPGTTACRASPVPVHCVTPTIGRCTRFRVPGMYTYVPGTWYRVMSSSLRCSTSDDHAVMLSVRLS